MTSAKLSDDPAAHVVLDAENPWPGLDFFSEESCDFFHGRVAEADLLLSMVRHRLLTVLYGQSGLGKSSLLQAGLFPRLRADGWLPVYIRLSHTDADGLGGTGATALIAQARQTIREAITDALEKGDFLASTEGNGESPAAFPRDDETLWEFLHRQESGLRTHDGSRVAPVLVFDQFEEIFTLGRNERRQAIRQTFLRDLADCVENRLPAEVLQEMNRSRRTEGSRFANLELTRQDYRIVLSLREDYLAELHDLSELMPSVHENETRLVPLNGWQALDAVSIPGESLIDPVVAREVVEIVAATRRSETAEDGADAAEGETEAIDETKLEVDPALLSMVCRELNIERQRRNQPKITPQIVEDLLKKRGRSVLHRFYTECFSLLPDRATAGQVQKFIEDDLLTPAGYRNMAELARAQQVLSRAGVPDPSAAIQQLINQRLLRVNERRQDKTKWLELTHDVLCDVVKESRSEREKREAQEREESAERERVARQLEEAERQRAESEEQARLAGEREATAVAKINQMRHQRRLGVMVLVLLLGLAGALCVAGFFAFGNWKTGAAAQKRSKQLVARAQEQLNEPAGDRRNVVLALQNLSRALRVDPGNKEAAKMACTLLMEKSWCPPLSAPLHYTGNSPLIVAAFTPKKGDIVAVAQDGNLVRWDARSFGQLPSVALAPARKSSDNRAVISSASFSEDGNRLLVGLAPANAENAHVWLWSDQANAYVEAGPIEFKEGFRSAAWSRDGSFLAIFPQRFDNPSCHVFVLEGTAYKHKAEIKNVMAGDISPDNQWLATGAAGGRVQLWDVRSLPPLPENSDAKKTLDPEEGLSDSRVSSLTFSGDGKELAVMGWREPARLWDISTGASRKLKDQITRVDFSSSPGREHRLAAGMNGMIARGGEHRPGPGMNGMICLWDTDKSGEFLAEPLCVSDPMIYPTFNSDGQKLITLTGAFGSSMETIRVWDTSFRYQGASAQGLGLDGRNAPAWLPDLVDAVTGTAGPTDDEDTPPPTLSTLHGDPNPPPPAQYLPLWKRFLVAPVNPPPVSNTP
jgi:WD40 repeat protein